MCPACGQPLVALELEGIEIDHCPACFGTWLDAGELEMICERAGAAAGALSRAVAGAIDGARSRRRCPRCPRRLRQVAVSSQPEVVLDRCPHGHGLWFDRGEMQTVIVSFARGEEGTVARFFADLLRGEIEALRQGD